MGTTRSVNTMAEGLQNMMGEISRMKLMPDADLEFLIGLETSILNYTHQQATQTTPQQQLGPYPPQQGAMMPSPMGSRLANVPPPAPGGGMPGGPPTPPNMDEIARALQ